MLLLTEIDLSDYEIAESISHKDILPNITEKSIIYAPFNTTIISQTSEQQQRAPVIIENSKLVFSSKVRELNRKYECNNNCDVDNGIAKVATDTEKVFVKV